MRISLAPEQIEAEHTMGRALHQECIDWLLAKAVQVLSLVKADADTYDFVLLDDVVFLGGGHFEFARHKPNEEATTALTVLARDRMFEPIDVVAWRPGRDFVATWLGRATLLGEEYLNTPRLGPLLVHKTLLGWLRAQRLGVVILNARRAAPLLRDAAPLAVASTEHRRELRDLLYQPPAAIVVEAA